MGWNTQFTQPISYVGRPGCRGRPERVPTHRVGGREGHEPYAPNPPLANLVLSVVYDFICDEMVFYTPPMCIANVRATSEL